jgi:hypothetical protein
VTPSAPTRTLRSTSPAKGLNTKKLADGPHSVTAKIKLRSGTKVASAAFTVQNASPAPTPTLKSPSNTGWSFA